MTFTPRSGYQEQPEQLLSQTDRDPRVIFDAVTHTDTRTGSVRELLRAVGGPSPRTKSGIDLRTAAATLGVSVSTLRRWLESERTGRGGPSPENRKMLNKIRRQLVNTKKGRRTALQRATWVKQARANGIRFELTGRMGPDGYPRARTARHAISPETTAELFDRWISQGHHAAINFLESVLDKYYLPGFRVGDVDALQLVALKDGEWEILRTSYEQG